MFAAIVIRVDCQGGIITQPELTTVDLPGFHHFINLFYLSLAKMKRNRGERVGTTSRASIATVIKMPKPLYHPIMFSILITRAYECSDIVPMGVLVTVMNVDLNLIPVVPGSSRM